MYSQLEEWHGVGVRLQLYCSIADPKGTPQENQGFGELVRISKQNLVANCRA